MRTRILLLGLLLWVVPACAQLYTGTDGKVHIRNADSSAVTDTATWATLADSAASAVRSWSGAGLLADSLAAAWDSSKVINWVQGQIGDTADVLRGEWQGALNDSGYLLPADTLSLSARINAKQDSSSAITWPDTISGPPATRTWVGAQGYLTVETGDISAVTAGAGLNGGGTSGAVTLNVDSVDIVTHTQLTAAGYLTSEVGDISSVVAGNGLTGGATSGAATLDLVGGYAQIVGADSTKPDTTKLATKYDLTLKATLASPTFTGTVTIPTPFTIGAVSMTTTGTELNYVAGVTSAIQTQLGTKFDVAGTGLTNSGTTLNFPSARGIVAGADAATLDTTGNYTWTGAMTFSGNVVNTANPWAVNEGGTGAATLTDGGILLGSGTGAITPLGQATNGQLPIGSTGADPVLATVTGTANDVIVTNAAGSITLSSKRLLTIYGFNNAAITADTWLQDGGGTSFSTTTGHVMPFAGSIVGIGIQATCSAKTTNGTVEVEVYANGVDVWDVATTITSVAVWNWSSTQNTGTDTFTAGQVISMNFDFTGFVGTLIRISVCLVVDG